MPVTFNLPCRYGVETNEISPLKLFKQYDEIGFLYPEKRKLLEPYLKQIESTWTILQKSDEELLWIQNAKSDEKGFASIAVWKQSNRGLFAQHLVSDGKSPVLTLRIMMAAQYKTEFQFTADEIYSSQNWFRPNNRYADRILGSLVRSLGKDLATRILHHYLHLSLSNIAEISTQVDEQYNVAPIKANNQALNDFVRHRYGPVFLNGEEIDSDDIELSKIAKIYGKYGLTKSRKVFVVCDKKNQIVAAAVANRAPLGLNFSMLENRCYFILDDALGGKERRSVVAHLVLATSDVYREFPLQAIPIVTDPATAHTLQELGAQEIRTYVQTIWLRDGFTSWHDHIDSFLKRIT